MCGIGVLLPSAGVRSSDGMVHQFRSFYPTGEVMSGFDIVTAGESHGKGLVMIISGIPANLSIDPSLINHELKRRQSGYGRGGRMKIEKDQIQVISGIRHGKTLGSPVSLLIENRDWANWDSAMAAELKELDEKEMRRVTRPRPGHADLAGALKYDTHDLRNILERSSARETAARVAIGGVARQFLKEFDIQIASHTLSIGEVSLPPDFVYNFEHICSVYEDAEIRCLDPMTARRMVAQIKKYHLAGDTLGGCFEVVARGVVPGLGSHIAWDQRLDGKLAQAIMSIHAVKAVEIGAGIRSGSIPGSLLHDEIGYDSSKKSFSRTTNNAGGIEGGISNGEDIIVRGHVKPIPTLRKPLKSVDVNTKEPFEAAYERSDTCVVPAAGVVGEAMTAIILAHLCLDKFGGDSMQETLKNYHGYLEQVRRF
jgi:chorismate synthase